MKIYLETNDFNRVCMIVTNIQKRNYDLVQSILKCLKCISPGFRLVGVKPGVILWWIDGIFICESAMNICYNQARENSANYL